MDDSRKDPGIGDFGSTATNLNSTEDLDPSTDFNPGNKLNESNDYYPDTASPALEAVFKTAELYGTHDFSDLSSPTNNSISIDNSFWHFAKKLVAYNFLAIVCGGLLGAGLAFATISGELDKYKQTIFGSLKTILQISGFAADSQKVLDDEQEL